MQSIPWSCLWRQSAEEAPTLPPAWIFQSTLNPKLPTAGGDQTTPPSNSKTIQRRETLSLTSGSLLWNCCAWGTLHFSTLKCLHVFFFYTFVISISTSCHPCYIAASVFVVRAESVLYCLTACESLSESGLLSSVRRLFCQKLTEKSKTIWLA